MEGETLESDVVIVGGGPSGLSAACRLKQLAQRVIDNHGNYVISLGQFCRWLAQQAEALGVEIYPGFAASDLLIDEHNVVRGIRTGDMGLDRKGEAKSGFTPGVYIRAKYTLFAEGCRGHLGKQLIQRYQLDRDGGVQHYAIGIKEVWEIDPAHFRPGKVVHAFGWPLAASGTGGGGFLYEQLDTDLTSGAIAGTIAP